MKADCVVLGAGIVGVSTALHLQARGRDVVLVDKNAAAGDETSFGNAGLIERCSIYPYSLPRDFSKLLKYAFNRAPESNYHLAALPSVLPWIIRYALKSGKTQIRKSAMASLALIERCVIEHQVLMNEAGVPELGLKTGWIKVFRDGKSLESGLQDAQKLKEFSINFDMLNALEVVLKEPHLSGVFTGGVHFTDPVFVPDPGALVKAYAALFKARGGRMVTGDAMTLGQTAKGWRVSVEGGSLDTTDAVVCLGPWAGGIYERLGYEIPLGLKRGYHMHYQRKGNAVLNHPVLDVDNGYLIAPMTRGVRLTTGAEFAKLGAPKTPVQLAKVEPIARVMFPLAERLDMEPWMGARPCLPDMLPVIGPAPKHRGLWFNFGHEHHGLTLGPVTGRLLAEMLTGAAPFTDPAPYSAARF